MRLTFARGASLDDPSELFNASLDAGTRRAIDIREGDEVDEKRSVRWFKSAAAFNALRRK